MKYIITENQNQKFFNMMYDYIEDLFPPGMGISYFDDYDEVNSPENIKHIDSIAFYNEDYDRQMTIYLENYWMNTELGMIKKRQFNTQYW